MEVDIQYSEKLHDLHNDLAFLQERMKIDKVKNLVTLKQALNQGLILKNVHRVIK